MASEDEIVNKIKNFKEQKSPNFEKYMNFYKEKFPDFYNSKLRGFEENNEQIIQMPKEEIAQKNSANPIEIKSLQEDSAFNLNDGKTQNIKEEAKGLILGQTTESATTSEPAPKKKSPLGMILIIALILALLGVAAGAAYYFGLI